MKNRNSCLTSGLIVLAFVVSVAPVTLVADVTDQSFTHFADFVNDSPAGALSEISSNTPATSYGEFGWHNSPHDLPDIAGILLDADYTVVGLRFQVHGNPFKDFILQGSNDTITGLDGNWDDVFSSTVTERSERAWQEWEFVNPNAYSAYRIYAQNAYVGGWAMYRWELLVPEPASMLLLGLGVLKLVRYRKK